MTVALAPLPIKVTPDPRAHKWAKGRTRIVDANLITEIKPAMSGSVLTLRRSHEAPLFINGWNNQTAIIVTETPAQIGAMLAAVGDYCQ